jgi:serine/threonine-protein kinase HipA
MPDPLYQRVPINEHAMMALAARVGIDIPEVGIQHRDQLPELPDAAWPNHEEWAFTIRRFDRGPSRELVHIEDMAQVRGFYPDADGKYQGSFETVASLYFRGGADPLSLLEFARRLAFCVLIENGDAHLKNWSLIYRDRARPQISPAYDLVCTGFYRVAGPGTPENLGLKLAGSRRFDRVKLDDFVQLARRINADPDLVVAAVRETAERTLAEWPGVAQEFLADFDPLRRHVDGRLASAARQLAR